MLNAIRLSSVSLKKNAGKCCEDFSVIKLVALIPVKCIKPTPIVRTIALIKLAILCDEEGTLCNHNNSKIAKCDTAIPTIIETKNRNQL